MQSGSDSVSVTAVDASGTTDAPPPVPVLAQAIRAFCRSCGAVMEAEAGICGRCESRLQAPVVPAPSVAESRPIARALGVYFSMLAVSVITILMAVAEVDELTLDIFASIGMTVVVLVAMSIFRREAFGPLVRLPHPGWLGAGVGLGIATFVLATVVVTLLNHLLDVPVYRYSDPYLNAGYGWALVALAFVVQPAIFEEVAFRGIILGSFKPLLTNLEAILVSSGLFMILHLSPMMFPHTFVMGLAAGYLCVRTGSLLPGIALHATHNGLCLLAEWAEVEGLLTL